MTFEAQLEKDIQQLKNQGLYRERQVRDVNDAARYFISNDYLGLSTHPAVNEGFERAYARYPSGSGGAALAGGYHPLHRELEMHAATLLQTDDALLLGTGYAANLAVGWVIAQLGAPVLLDKRCHASMYDGLRLVNRQSHRFLHQDVVDLAKKRQTFQQPCVILTEGIFSMSGQMAPLDAFFEHALMPHDALIVDEAHSFGILGEKGLGSIPHHGLTQNEVPLRVIPLGKAIGSHGALIAGQRVWVDALIQYARSYIYSTLPSPAHAAGLMCALDSLCQADAARSALFQCIAYFRQKVAGSGLDFLDSHTPIQFLRLSCPHKALAWSAALKAQGIYCQAIRQPTVPANQSGLRIVLTAKHRPCDLDALFAALEHLHEG